MKTKKKIILLSIIFGIIITLLVFFLILPLFRSIDEGLQEIAETRKEIISSGEEAERFKEFNNIYKKIEPSIGRINQLFIDPEVPINLIEFLEKEAGQQNLLIKISLSSLKEEKGVFWSSTGFQINLSGSFSDFSKFLRKIESGPYLIEIQRMVLDKSEGIEKINKLGEREKPRVIKSGEEAGVKANLLIRVFSRQKNEKKEVQKERK